MRFPRARIGRATAIVACLVFAASRARSEEAHAETGSAEGGDAKLASGTVTREASVDAGVSGSADGSDFSGEPVEIPVARETATPGAATSEIAVADFAGESKSVAQLLAAAPGTTVRALGGPLSSATVSLRGASADESLVLLDGIPLHGPGGGAFDLSQIPAQLISRIEVHRGVLGAQLGAGALGGAIEIVPREAEDEARGGARASFGSFGTAQLEADASGAKGTALEGATLGLQLDRTEGDFTYLRNRTPDDPSAPLVEETRENDDAKSLGFLAREARALGGGSTLELIALGSAGDRGVPAPEGFTSVERSQEQSGTLGARYRALFGGAVLSARAWAQGDRIVLSGEGSGGFNTCATEPQAAVCAAKENHSLSARGAGELALPLGGAESAAGAHWLVASAEGGEDWFAGAGSGAHRRGAGTIALRDDASFAQGRLELHPALRLDAIASYLAASPALALVARPFSGALAGLGLRASGGLSFRPPTFSELYLAQGGILPDPALKPERAGSLELGADWTRGALALAASGFWSRYRDLILYQLTSSQQQEAYNDGAARVLGAELEAHLALPLGFSAEASWSWLDAIDEEPAATTRGNQLPYRPPFRLFARLARKGDRLEGFAECDWSSSMPRNQFATGTLPAQLTFDAGAGARVVGPLWVDLEVKNLLDDRTLQDLFQYPLPGVSFTAIARARF